MGIFINLIGVKFGKLTVISRHSDNNAGFAVWLCQCDCGNTHTLRGDALRTGNTKSCGKCSRGIDETGKRYGKLTVISLGKKFKGNNATTWVCKCDCGTTVTRVGASLRYGRTFSCGCTNLERVREANALPGNEAAFNRIVLQIKDSAKRRGLVYSLTLDEIKTLVVKECYYCGLEPSNNTRRHKREFKYSGLDRLNNKKGYEYGNVLPCCKICNHAKSTMTTGNFLAWIERIYERTIRNPRIKLNVPKLTNS